MKAWSGKFAPGVPNAVHFLMAFKPEKYMEPLLALVTRTLVMPDGRTQDFCVMQVYWDAYDFLAERLRLSDSILNEAERLAAVHGSDLDKTFAAKIASLARWVKETLNLTVPFDLPIDPLFHLPTIPQWYIDAYRRGDIA